MSSMITQLNEALSHNKADDILRLESCLSNNISNAIRDPLFFNLPFSEISNIIKRTDFICDTDPLSTIKSLIQGVNRTYPNESILLLNIISKENIPDFSLKDIIVIISEFKSSDLLVLVGAKQEEEDMLLQRDWEWEVRERDNKITILEGQINELKQRYERKREFKPITEAPKDLSEDIFSAASSGQLDSVQYLIEQQHVNKESTDKYGNTPLHLACSNGRLEVVQYLIEQQHVNKESTNDFGKSPFDLVPDSQKSKFQQFFE